MGTYDFQQATADRIAEIFRKATIGDDGREIPSGGQRRVLLADEVGLGKTVMAKEVIERVRKMREEVGDKMFRVVYVCSNMNIVRQNIACLGIKEKLDVSESRLSMQHLIISKKDRELEINHPDEMSAMIIPLTPGTSFSQNGSRIGNMPERALIVVVLERMRGFEPYSGQLRNLFRSEKVKRGSGGWKWWLERFEKEVDLLGPQYIKTISDKLELYDEYHEIKKNLISILADGEEWGPKIQTIIMQLRRIFADLSLSMLKPDLIIMDEFQRFSSLLDYDDDSEQRAIVKKFFEQQDGQQPMILLLSATPYKPYTTLEELSEYNIDQHYDDFNRLMNFLFPGDGKFRSLWSDYSHNISHLATQNLEVVLASKNTVEDKMYEGMCRTERLNHGLISTAFVKEAPVTEYDIIAYCEMQNIMKQCRHIAENSADIKFHKANVPVEYVKSAPYLLSFMDSYELKKQISDSYATHKAKLPAPGKTVLLREDDINRFRAIPPANARLDFLEKMVIPDRSDAELLLWVPAAMPYYKTDNNNPFEKNRSFSKTLVFSSWEMVPRMISVLMTYYAEREVMYKKRSKLKYNGNKGADRIKEKGRLKDILVYASRYLAGLISPKNSKGRSLDEIRNEISEKIKSRLEGIPMSERGGTGAIFELLQWLDSKSEFKPEIVPANTVEFLTDMAIGGPGVCLYRILGDERLVAEASSGFITLFNRRIAGYIVDTISERRGVHEAYIAGVMNYCVLGNLQAVLDEFYHLCAGKDDFIERLQNCFIREVPLQVDTYESFYKGSSVSKKPMRTYYAVSFARGKKTLDEKGEKRVNNMRTAFQSPFYPFVLSSTSVGQEGLDFHWYCRRVVHWNLPSNPQDLEQREGRVNRYKCLAIRRNLAHRFQNSLDVYEWENLFRTANERVRKDFGSKYSEMVPNWCLPVEWIDKEDDACGEIEWIERVVPQYPLSSDVNRYNRLIDVLSLYRLTLGQPRQEELLQMLESQNLSDEQIRELLFNLSPINRK